VRVTEPFSAGLSERVAVSVRASASGPFSCTALPLVVLFCEDVTMIVPAVSVCVAAFAPVAVNAPLPVTVIGSEPVTEVVIKKLALSAPVAIVRLLDVTGVVQLLSVKNAVPAGPEGAKTSVLPTFAALPELSCDCTVSTAEHTPTDSVCAGLVKARLVGAEETMLTGTAGGAPWGNPFGYRKSVTNKP